MILSYKVRNWRYYIFMIFWFLPFPMHCQAPHWVWVKDLESSYLPIISFYVHPRSICEFVCPSTASLRKLSITLDPCIRNILIKFCIYIDIDKRSEDPLPSWISRRTRLCRGPNSEKNETGPYNLLNWVDYSDEILHTHWDWQGLALNCVEFFVEPLILTRMSNAVLCRGPNSDKSETGPTSWTFWNISIKYCLHIDIDKLQPKVLPNIVFHTVWSRLCRGQNLKKLNWP